MNKKNIKFDDLNLPDKKNNIRFLILGDIVGRLGRKIILQNIDTIKSEFNIDFININYENSSHGHGMTVNHAHEFFKNKSINSMTGGNHSWDTQILHDEFQNKDSFVNKFLTVPLNVNNREGNGFLFFEVLTQNKKLKKILIINVIGLQSIFSSYGTTSPFDAVNKLLEKYSKKDYIILIDFHGESTGEKKSFQHYFSNKVSIIVGTHTHVQTNDTCILNNTGINSDLGFCGAYNSILGFEASEVLNRYFSNKKINSNPKIDGIGILSGVICDIDSLTNNCTFIKNVNFFIHP